MKKIKTLLIIFILFLVSGCYRGDLLIKINDDKSYVVNFEIKFEKENLEQTTNIFTKEEISNLEQDGYEVTEINNDKYVGYKLERKGKTIEEITTNENDRFNISIFLFERVKFDNLKLFYSKDKKTYKSNIVYKIEKSESEYMNLDEPELVFKIQLPSKPISHNASLVSKDEKTLTWNLKNITEKNIDFEFKFNQEKIDIFLILGIISGIILLIIIILIRKKPDIPSLAGQTFEPGNQKEKPDLERPMDNFVGKEKPEPALVTDSN